MNRVNTIGKVLITGATSGIGKQLAIDYANNHWQVIACGRDQQKLQLLQQQLPNNVEIKQFDITDPTATHDALQHVDVELVILVAGTCEYIDNGQIEHQLFQRVITTNLFGPVNCIEALLPQLKAGSRLALVGSMSAWFPFPRAEAYGASKAAVAYLAKSLSASLAYKKIAVSLIEPGFVDTPLTKKNTFAMPTLITVEQASAAIRAGLAKGQSQIAFPFRLAFILRLLTWLPNSLQQKIAIKMVRVEK